MKYKVVYASDSQIFEQQVNDALSAGWYLYGSPCFIQIPGSLPRFMQALARKSLGA